MATAISFSDVSVLYEGFASFGGFVNGCGQAATLMMTGLVRGQPVSTNDLLNVIKYSVATGHATTSGRSIGSTTPSDLQWIAEQQGVKTQLGPGSAWRSTVDTAIPQGKPVVLGVANARAFGGSDANVQGHYVTVVGTTTDGRYIVADPNQQAARTGGTVIYSAVQIQQARPFATLTPTGTVQTMNSNTSAGDCLHSISLPGGSTICMDPLLDGVVRGSLIAAGALLILVAILIFTRKEWGPIAADTAKVGAVAAAA